MDLHRTQFRVIQTAAVGVVSSDTLLDLQQHGSRVVGRYSGGTVQRGRLVGVVTDSVLRFRYVQREQSGEVHAGRSVCTVDVADGGRRYLREHFIWETRQGTGVNVFEEIPQSS